MQYKSQGKLSAFIFKAGYNNSMKLLQLFSVILNVLLFLPKSLLSKLQETVYLLLHKKTLCLYCLFSLGRNQTPFSLTTDHPWQAVAELTQAPKLFECSSCWGCAMSCGSRWASKYLESPATRGSKPTGARGTVITRSP